MIKIYDKLWYVVDASRDDNLAYMTYYQDNAAFEKRKQTGVSWARRRKTGRNSDGSSGYFTTDGKEYTCDNTPTTGFYIGDSVSRWSTSNKLFRVKDPRGFTVEVPTGNISTLLHHTTVNRGVVQEPCVWGREGSNHILLPVDSDPYRKGCKNMEVLAAPNKSIKDIPYGSKVKLTGSNVEYTFVGRGQFTFTVKPCIRHRWCTTSGRQGKTYLPEYEYIRKSYKNIFSRTNDEGYESFITYSNNPVVEVLENGDGKVQFKGDFSSIRDWVKVKDEENHYSVSTKYIKWK